VRLDLTTHYPCYVHRDCRPWACLAPERTPSCPDPGVIERGRLSSDGVRSPASKREVSIAAVRAGDGDPRACR
jgi:hypothetical protein